MPINTKLVGFTVATSVEEPGGLALVQISLRVEGPDAMRLVGLLYEQYAGGTNVTAPAPLPPAPPAPPVVERVVPPRDPGATLVESVVAERQQAAEPPKPRAKKEAPKEPAKPEPAKAAEPPKQLDLPAPAGPPAADAPADLVASGSFRNVMTWMLANGFKEADQIAAKCLELRAAVPALSRLPADTLKDRVERALLVLKMES